jgi:AcrR family transcriptional regulator
VASRRPPNRKALIRSTAGELFLTRGYHNVSVTDVAEALEIAPSALYHHYRNKQELLLHAVLDALERVDVEVRAADTLDDALRYLARLVSAPGRSLAVWEREARNLEGDQRELIRSREAEVVGRLVPLLEHERPGLDTDDGLLLARAIFGVLGSRVQHRLTLGRRKDEQLMTRLAGVVADCRLSSPAVRRAGAGVPHPQPAALRPPRRDVLLREAVRLFDERGYQSVTMADIGEAAGIVASGVYRHFPSKTAILVTAANRGGERIRSGVDRALTQARDPRDALAGLLRSHVDVTIDQQHLVGLLSNEADLLPDEDRRALRRFQHDYLDLWVRALDAVVDGERDVNELKIVVHAVHSMTYFVVRRAGDTAEANLGARLHDLGMALLHHG